MNRFKVRISNIINKFQKKSIDNLQNIKGFFVGRAEKILINLKQFLWILKVILTYKPEKKQKKPKQKLNFLQRSFTRFLQRSSPRFLQRHSPRFLQRSSPRKKNIKAPVKIKTQKNKKQLLRNLGIYLQQNGKRFLQILKISFAWNAYKYLQKINQLFRDLKEFLVRLTGNLINNIKLLFTIITNFLAKAGKNIRIKAKQLSYVIRVSFAWKTAKLQKNTELFFLSAKEIFAEFNKKLALIKKPSIRDIKEFFTGKIKNLTPKRKLSFSGKKISQNAVYFFLSIKEFFARKSFKYNILIAVKFFFLKQIKLFLNNIKLFLLFLKNLSARQTIRVDIFLIIIILILIINPLIINNIGSSEVKTKQITLFLSMNCEKLLGSDITKMLLEDFNRQNPDIQLLLHDGQTGEAEREPDILIFDESEYNSLFSAGKLAELSAYDIWENSDLHESEEHHDEIQTSPSHSAELPAAMSPAQYAIPLVSFMDMLFYNIDILTAAGFDHPPKTREEFIKCAGAVSRGNFPGMSGALLSLKADDHQALSRDIFSWLWAGGVNFWQDGDKPILTSSANMRAMTGDFTFLAGIHREVQTHGIFGRTGSQSLEEFAQGKVALLITSTSNIPYLRERMGDGKFGITTIPGSGTGGRYGIALSSIYAGINSSTPETSEESLLAMSRFLKFLSEKTEIYCAELKAIPGSVINPIPGKYIRDDSYYSKAWDIFEASRIVQGFTGKPGAEEYEAIFLEELQLFFEGGKNAQQTIVSIQRRWDDVRIN